MGVFKRLGSLVRGFFSKITGKIEEKNPELLLEDARNKIERARKDAEKNIIEIQTNAELERLDMKNIEKNLENLRIQIEAAAEKNDRELLIELLIREEEEKNLYEIKKESHSLAVAEALRIRDEYKMFESEMNSWIAEIRALKSRARMAAIKESIAQLDKKYAGSFSRGFNNSEISDNMNKAREIVNLKNARADACQALREDTTEYKLKRLDASIRRERAIKRADEMLASRGNAI